MPATPELAHSPTRLLSQAEFPAWLRSRPASDCNRYELLQGRVVMTPPAGHPHGFIEGKISTLLGSFIRDRALGVHLGSSQGFDLPSGDTVEPDQSFVSTARWQAMPPPRDGEFLKVVPDLVIEILSPSTAARDRGDKRAIYELNRVREYWLVDSRARVVTVFTLRGDKFDDPCQVYPEGSVLQSAVLSGLAVDVQSILPPPS